MNGWGLVTEHGRAPLLLGIDIGTYESKGALVTANGELVASARVPHRLHVPRPGWAEHDADAVWWHDTVQLCRQLVTQRGIDPARILAVGCSAIAPCMLPLDAAGRPLRPAILYGIDTRTAEEITELEEELGRTTIFNVTGNHLSTQSVGPKIRWFAKHEPHLFQRMSQVVTASTYLVYRFTGELVLDYYTACSFQPMFDLDQRSWSLSLTEPIVPIDRLPRLAWPAEIAGTITPTAAAETGLAVGTPVVVGTADAASEAISAGAVQQRDLMVMYGSTTFFIETLERRVTTEQLWSSLALEPGAYTLTAGMATTGAVTRWFRDELARDQLQVARAEEAGDAAYSALVAEAAGTPAGAEGLVVLPYFSGERTPIQDPKARGVIAGLTLAHTRGHLYRAVLEGIAYGVRHHIDVMDAYGVPPRRLVAVGGGTQNEVWLQAVSDVTGLPQEVPAQQLGAAYGDAFLAAIGAGLYREIGEVRNWVRSGRTVEPNPAHRDLYDDLYGVYRRLYEASREELHRLAVLGEERNSE